MGGALVAVPGLRAKAALAGAVLDVQILQTASALEAVAVAVYDAPWAGGAGLGRPAATTLATFAVESRRQHTSHLRAFQARTTATDPAARIQEDPHPRFQALLAAADLGSAGKLVELAALIEQATTDTYLRNLALLQDTTTKALMGSVMALAGQRLAALRTFRSLLGAGAPQFVEVPLPLAALVRLPQSAGSAAFPAALHAAGPPELIAEPGSGAPR